MKETKNKTITVNFSKFVKKNKTNQFKTSLKKTTNLILTLYVPTLV